MNAERLGLLGMSGLGLLALIGCNSPASERSDDPPAAVHESPAPVEPPSAEPTIDRLDRLDAHVHLVEGAVDELLAALDRQQIAAAVVVASPHLDPRSGVTLDDSGILPGWRAANDTLLAETAAHRDRLFPFITVEPAEVELAELERWFEQGACGVKLYFGHQRLHARPLDDPGHEPLFDWLEARGTPVLAHVNTVRYRDEFASLLREHPKLALVCPHLCGSRTDLDRLAGLLREFPTLQVDTSHGAGEHGIAGFTAIERDRDRLRAMILAEPERFVFGSDLVTTRSPVGPAATAEEWDMQLAANLGLIERDQFEFWRQVEGAARGGLEPGRYRGLALDEPARSRVLAGNAREWLGSCRR